MLAFKTDLALAYDGLFFDGDAIGWAARNSSKPDRSGNTWIVHATPAWTRRHCDEPAEIIAADLMKIFNTQLGLDLADLVAQTAHFWRYALVENPLDDGAIWDPGLGLGLCGDWCQGARGEGAFLSGQAIARRMLGYLADINKSKVESAPIALGVSQTH